jgi:hypothetical protein
MPDPKPKRRKKAKKTHTKILREVWIRDKFTCQMCGKNIAWSSNGKLRSYVPHHIKYRSQGGSWAPENLILFCPECHEKAHRHMWEYEPLSKHEFMTRCRRHINPHKSTYSTDFTDSTDPTCPADFADFTDCTYST